MAEPRLVVARPADRVAEACALARRHGFDPLPAPLLEVRPLDDPRFDEVVAGLRAGALPWAVFTSATGVAVAWEKAGARGLDLGALLAGVGVAAVGPPTAAALRDRGLAPQVPARHDSAGLVELLTRAGAGGARVALLRSDRGSAELPVGLAAAGAAVLDVPMYALALPADLGPARAAVRATAEGAVDAAAFTSSLAAHHFLGLARDLGLEAEARRGLARARVGALGEPTARALGAAGVRVDAVPPEARFEALLPLLHPRPREVLP